MARRKWLGWLVVLAVVLAAGGGLWFAHAQGWLDPAYAWFQQLTSNDDTGQPGHGGMNMPGMDEEASVPGHAEVTIPGEIQQRIGVTVGRVEEGPLEMSVRTVGIVRPDETKMARVNLRTEGWVEKLYVNYTGQPVKEGAKLLAIYSPQFLTTQQEYLSNRSSGNRLARSALRRLRLWGIAPQELKGLERTGKAQENLILRSPITGTILIKNVLEGEHVTPGRQLYEVADLSTVWVQAKVYEYELTHVQLGQPAQVTFSALPGRQFTGKVVFIQPTVEEPSRTVQVRIELRNKQGLFKPGMFADVVIRHDMGTGLLVPVTAVIRTGERDIVYRVVGPGRFLPVVVKVGPLTYGNRFRVLAGLQPGDRVSTSANFLIDSESRLQAGGGGMAGMAGMDMGGMDMKGKDQKKGGPKRDKHKGMDRKDMDMKDMNMKGMKRPAQDSPEHKDHSHGDH
jgi:Cu(I)/Ag(I) efflux system membrane fusion protein